MPLAATAAAPLARLVLFVAVRQTSFLHVRHRTDLRRDPYKRGEWFGLGTYPCERLVRTLTVNHGLICKMFGIHNLLLQDQKLNNIASDWRDSYGGDLRDALDDDSRQDPTITLCVFRLRPCSPPLRRWIVTRRQRPPPVLSPSEFVPPATTSMTQLWSRLAQTVDEWALLQLTCLFHSSDHGRQHVLLITFHTLAGRTL